MLIVFFFLVLFFLPFFSSSSCSHTSTISEPEGKRVPTEDEIASLFEHIEERRYEEAERMLQAFELDVNEPRDELGRPLLTMAACCSKDEGGLKMMESLMRRGALVNLQDDEGWTALMYAARSSNDTSSLEAVKLLIERGADPNIGDIEGETPLIVAVCFAGEESSLETVQCCKI
jgi:ankyrin repeat protein